jgi:hypothetical protein
VSLLLPLHAEFLYKDDVVKDKNFAKQVELIGSELKAKTGVSLYLVMVRDLDENQSISDFEKQISADTNDSAVIMTFVELKKQVDILARPTSLYKDFDKAQVLSPNATFIGGVVTSVMYARSVDEAKELLSHTGGTIFPILSERAKGDDIVKKYAAGMFNGYSDVAEQIAASRGVTLDNAAGTANQTFIDIIRLVFYGTLLYAVVMIVRRKIARRKMERSDGE